VTSAPEIAIQALVKRYGSATALDRVSLDLFPGSVVALLGPNGAGKTTALEILMGLRQPTEGGACIRGVGLRSPGIHAVRERVGYLPESPVLYDHLTGREFLQFIGELHGPRRDRAERIERALERLGLLGSADTLVSTYSLGMRKRLAFLAATVGDPEILILDEPTGSMDAASARVVKDTMIEHRERGRLVLFTTHVLEIAEAMADRLVILANGRLRFDGSLAELRERAGPGGSSGSLEELFLGMTAPEGSSGATP
jgi:ABC-2 type transport system ATP-binding protein